MADTPTRTDTPPPPPKPPEQSLKPSPEMQRKLDTFRAQKEARQDVDHRVAKAENLAARTAPKAEGTAPQPRQADNATQRPQRAENAAKLPSRPEGTTPQQRAENVVPQQRSGDGTRPNEAPTKDRSAPEPPGLRPSPEMQQKLDDFRAQKEARQDASQAVDHRAAKAENLAAREAARKPSEGSAPVQQQRPQETAAAKQAETGPGEARSTLAETKPGEARNTPAETKAAEPELKTAAGADQGGGRLGDTPSGVPSAAADGDRWSYSAKHLNPAADLRRQPDEQKATVESGEQPVGKCARPEAGSEYTGPERRQHEAQLLNPADDRRDLPVEPNTNSRSDERLHGEHYRNETGAGSGPWFDEGTNHREGGAVQQMTEGSCVSAAGEMLTDGRVTQEQLHARLDDWSNPTALRDELNERDGGGWQGHYFVSGDDAVRRASEGPMAAVVQAPGGAGHMVMLEPRSDGTFTVRDPYESSSYDVDSGWIDTYVSAGVWHE